MKPAANDIQRDESENPERTENGNNEAALLTMQKNLQTENLVLQSAKTVEMRLQQTCRQIPMRQTYRQIPKKNFPFCSTAIDVFFPAEFDVIFFYLIDLFSQTTVSTLTNAGKNLKQYYSGKEWT